MIIRGQGKAKKAIFLSFFVFIASLGYGFYRLHLPLAPCPLPQLKVSVIQGNIPQGLKWQEGTAQFILDKYLKLTRLASHENPDLVIWPEAALPVVLEDEPIFFRQAADLARELNLPMLLGAVTHKGDAYYNSAIFISENGKISNYYDKLHLVPFGEYIPLRNFLPFLQKVVPIGEIFRGKRYTVFTGSPSHQVTKSPVNFSVLICFEDLFPELSRRFVKKEPAY